MIIGGVAILGISEMGAQNFIIVIFYEPIFAGELTMIDEHRRG